MDSPDGTPVEDQTERDKIYNLNEFSIDPKLDLRNNSVKYLLFGVVDADIKYYNDNGTTVPKIVPRKYHYNCLSMYHLM